MPVEKREWVGGRVANHTELDAADQTFWSHAEPAERCEASIELSLTAWSLRHPDEPPPRFGRDAFGVRRRRGAVPGDRRPRGVPARAASDHEGSGSVARRRA